MRSEALIHDAAWVTAEHVFDLFAPLLCEEEQREVFAAIYVRVKAGLECYEIQAGRRPSWLRPGNN